MRDCRNEFVNNLKCSMKWYLDQSNLDKVMANIIELLDPYELSERVTTLVPKDDINERIARNYMNCLALNGKSNNTIYMYLRQIARFNKFTGNKSFKDIRTFDIRGYLAQEKVNGLSSVSLENIRTSLNAFFRWLVDEEYIDKNPCGAIKPIKCHKEIKHPFSTVEQDALRNHCKDLKERAMIEVLLSSGVRVSELVGLDVADIDFNNKAVHIRHGKGDKERCTYINDLALNYLVKYLLDAQITVGPLFQNKSGKRYTTAGIRFILNQIASRANVQNVHPHRFRRTFATTLATRGMDIQDIQTLMGHIDINTTMVYVTSSDTKVNNSYRKFTL